MTKKSKGTDRFAEASNRLNEYNANKQYEALLAEQEKIKASKGIKPKKKSIVPAYEDGVGENKKLIPDYLNKELYDPTLYNGDKEKTIPLA